MKNKIIALLIILTTPVWIVPLALIGCALGIISLYQTILETLED